jgi:cytochrome c biogenesis protein CcmG/thiol:disulfide interchange protein DsbE
MTTIEGVKRVCPVGQKVSNIAAESQIKHNKGEVWLVDFWATWCPPCQAPMAHNQNMMQRNAKKWGPEVKFICISCDADSKKLMDHINAKNWTNLDHYVQTDQRLPSKTFSVRGIPHVMLVDKKGVVVFKGSPYARKDLEKDIFRLVNDQ